MTEAAQACAADQPSLPADVVAPATDDHPFLYFRGEQHPVDLPVGPRQHPARVAHCHSQGAAALSVRMRPYLDLFFMGAAFLLLETKSVATFALLFGTTWFVNALVFAGVLRRRAARRSR